MLLADLQQIREVNAPEVDRAISRLAGWLQTHPTATMVEIVRTVEYRGVLIAFQAEVDAMQQALVESLPPLAQEERRRAAADRG